MCVMCSCSVWLVTRIDVILVGKDEGDAPKNTVHQPLECLGGIIKPEGHVEELPEIEGSDDGHLVDVCRCDGDLLVATDQIYLRKYHLAQSLQILNTTNDCVAILLQSYMFSASC